MSARPFRIAAVGDLHCTAHSGGLIRPVFDRIEADVLLLCGDLTDYGTVAEARVLAAELKGAVTCPIGAVLGNHDYECGQQDEVKAILEGELGVQMLDGHAWEVGGVGFAGAKGFAGGFGRGALGPWGEPAIKRFVKEVLDEALAFEAALMRLRTKRRVGVLHYSPVRSTVEGEPAEIFPYLGCSRLEEPLVRYPVDVVFHGHAHHGSPEGRTSNGIPVFNVAMPLLRRLSPGQTPVRLYDLVPPKEEALASAVGS